MESKNMIGGIVSLAVVVICVAAIMMPVLNDATTTEKTFTNEGYYRMSETSDETVITWTPSEDAYAITINGSEVSLEALGDEYKYYSLAFANDFVLRFYTTATITGMQLLQSAYVIGLGSSSASTYTLTITINSEGISWITNAEGATATTCEHEGSYFLIDGEGEYTMKYSSSSAYVNTSSTIIYAGGVSNIANNTDSSIYIEGTIDDLSVTPLNTDVTVSDIEVTYTDVEGYEDLSLLSKITFTTTYNTDEVAQTYSYFLVPYEITAELSQHLGTAEIALVNAIPVLVIVSLVVAAAGMLVVRNRD